MKESHFGGRCLIPLLAVLLLIAPLGVWAQTWYDHIDGTYEFSNDDPTYNVRHSDHTRLRWGKNNVSGISVDEDFIQENLQNLERHWHLMFDTPGNGGCGFPSPSVLWSGDDGKRYRSNFRAGQTWGNPDDGGAGGSVDWDGIPTYGMGPWAMAPSAPTTVTYHEFGHGILIWMKGLNNTPYDGMWHEGWANFSEEQAANDIDPSNMLWCHSFFLPHGRDYYDSWVWWEHLRENPTYGPTFLTTLFQGCQGSNGEYVFDAMVRLDTSGSADHPNAIKDLLGQYARKNITWDYERGDMMRNYSFLPSITDPLNDQYRKAISELVKEPGSTTTWRLPFDQAPSQGGYVVIPFKLTSKSGGAYSVGVNFKPLWDGLRGSDWRCTLVAVSDNGNARYSSMWNTGTNTIVLSADENKLYLVAAATPTFMGDPGRSFLYQAPVQPQAFEISLVSTSATIYESVPTASHTGMHQHSNGGGWVSDTATVDSSAYVGPNAMVLNSAHVHNNSRLEDYAVVSGNADVRDNALITGHALVKDSAQVYGYAKIRDWATIASNAQVYEYARILEHAYVSETATIHGNATEKGCTYDGGVANVNGYAIKEGDCLNTANFDHGVLMCWVWGIDQAFADSQPDIAGLYCGYDFEKANPIYAMDTNGIIHGYLMGAPSRVQIADRYRDYTLSLNGTSQYVELHNDVNDFKDTTIACWVKWTGSANDQRLLSFGNGSNKYMYLTPKDASTSKLRFIITNGSTTQYLDGTAALTANRWTHVAVTFSGNTGTLYVDGTAVDTDTGITLNPDDLNGANTLAGGNCNYIGKSPAGNYFAGYIDDFKIYSQAQAAGVITTLAGQFVDRNAGPGVPPGGGTVTPTPLVTLTASGLSLGALTTWTNTGSLGGSFGNNGTSLTVQDVAGKRCVTFSGSANMKSTFTAPAGITSNGDWSVSCWAYNPSISAEECMVSWADRSGGSRDMQFNYGNATGWGAATHMSNDLGWYNAIAPTAGAWHHLVLTFTGGTNGTEIVYVDGVSNNTAVKTLNLFTGEYMFVGCATDNSGGTPSYNFSGSLAKVQVYDVALTSTDVGHLYYNDLYPPADTTPPTPTTETWLVNPAAVNSGSITMSATKGSDTSGVLYSFTCTAGGGHNSGWISTNKYTDLGLTAGTSYTYTVQMKDTVGNTGTVSTSKSATTSANDASAPTPNPATFAVAPIGISTSAITMTATKATDANPLIEYKFTRNDAVTSGWQASPTWTNTGLTSGNSYTYTVQTRDGKGNTGTASAASPSTIVRDSKTPTITSVARAVWQMRPYIKTDGKLWMRARTATDPSGVQYNFHCTSGGGPDSGWQDSNEWTSSTAVANGTYTYTYQVRDKSPQYNATGYLGSINVVVTNLNIYHDYAVSALSGLADETLAHFTGTVTTVNADNYIVTSSGSTIRVFPNTTNGATDSGLLNKSVDVKACLWTYTAYGKVANFATVAAIVAGSTDLAYYRFDETSGSTAADSSGNGKNGTCSGGYTWGAGKIANCITLNGTTGYVSVPNLGTQSSFTISTWIYLSAYPADYGGIFLTDTWAAGYLHCNLLPSGLFACQVNGWSASATSTTALPLSTWKHIAMVYDGSAKTVKIYIDGVQNGSTTSLTTAVDAIMNGGKIGSWAGTSRFINGKFDDYRILGRAMSASEVASLYAAGGSDMVAYYRFDEASGTSAYDSSGHGKTGTLNGGCSWVVGKTANGVNLDGTNGYVSLPNGLVSALTNFSIVAWVKLDANNTWNRIFDFGTGSSYYMFLTGNAGSIVRYAIKANGGEQQINSTSALTTGAWHQVAVTQSGTTGTLYVDGAQAGQNTGMTLNPSSLGSTTQTWIGRSQFSDPYLDGIVDGFRIYNRALSGTEITTLYGGGAGAASFDGGSDSGWDIYPAK